MKAKAKAKNKAPAGAKSESVENAESAGRAAAWGLLAAPLTTAPGPKMLAHYAALDGDGSGRSGPGGEAGNDACADALRALALAAGGTDAESAADDYQDLLIGLGRGKVVPYGSWYVAGALMDRPLARLRADLRALGVARSPGVKEPEDHAGALCETLAMLAADESAPSFGRQKKFFDAHAAPWLGRFFADLADAAETPFYRALGGFGTAFFALESRYFSMPF